MDERRSHAKQAFRRLCGAVHLRRRGVPLYLTVHCGPSIDRREALGAAAHAAAGRNVSSITERRSTGPILETGYGDL